MTFCTAALTFQILIPIYTQCLWRLLLFLLATGQAVKSLIQRIFSIPQVISKTSLWVRYLVFGRSEVVFDAIYLNFLDLISNVGSGLAIMLVAHHSVLVA